MVHRNDYEILLKPIGTKTEQIKVQVFRVQCQVQKPIVFFYRIAMKRIKMNLKPIPFVIVVKIIKYLKIYLTE